MRIAVLFDGAGLARLGLERAGHFCVGVELNPVAHHLSKSVGSGNCVLGDATKFDLSGFDAVWASPPCSKRSSVPKDLTGRKGLRDAQYQQDYLQQCLEIRGLATVWVENVMIQGRKGNDWGMHYNAAQFQRTPVQCRNRIVGGRFRQPDTFRDYRRYYPGLCPCISATEYKGCASDRCRASRFYGRKLTVRECAYHQGFSIPRSWFKIPDWYLPDARPASRVVQWERRLYEAIGNGVPVYMARAFGKEYT